MGARECNEAIEQRPTKRAPGRLGEPSLPVSSSAKKRRSGGAVADLGEVLGRLSGLAVDRHYQGEGGAFERGACHAQIRAHHRGEALADGQAQACAPILSRGRSVSLSERLEKLLYLIGCDSDACVADLKHD